MKKIFLAATQQNDGKTTIALGLLFNLKKRFPRIGFIKPIGQRYLEEEGLKVDEDSILIERVAEICGISCLLKDMSPIAVERGFTQRYIYTPQKNLLTKQIKDSFKRIAQDKDLVIIEGTGHAGVGSVFDHSNATVARLLKAKVILISSGGIGRPIDEIMLNKALFEKENVTLLGVIINKVLPNKFKKIKNIIKKGLSRKGIRLLGVLPYVPFLSYPTVSQILEETNFKLISGEERLNNLIKKIIVGAMEPYNALSYIEDNSLLITPGDREDMLLAVLSYHLIAKENTSRISGIILTGGIFPNRKVLSIIKKSHIPLLLAEEDTYQVASKVHDLTVKIRPQDQEKIDLTIKLVKENLNLKKLIEWM